jgi:CRISPR-associated protein Cmr6
MPSLPSVRRRLADLRHDPQTHAGLWHDVFVPELRGPDTGTITPPQDALGEKHRAHLEQVAGLCTPDGYLAALRAREDLLRALHGGVDGGVTRCFSATTRGRMVVGLGVQTPLETHVSLQRTWGVPWIPGSALKGLASSTAHRSGEASWKRATVEVPGGSDARTLFGDLTTQGAVTFHDAWWIPEGGSPKLPLDPDVMTVHHPKYYGGSEAPQDWDEPTPVSFLTATGSYLVALSGPSVWVDVAAEWLRIGLRNDGIGAKTHAGYGRMTLDARLSDDERRARALVDGVRALPAQHRGAPTARQHIAALGQVMDKGADRAQLRTVAAELFERDSTFWRKWAREPQRTDTELEILGSLDMIPAEIASVVVAAPPPAPTADVWERGAGWIVKDAKNRAIAWVRVGDVTLERHVHLLSPSLDLRAALELASAEAPLPIEVHRIDKKRFEIRAPRSPHDSARDPETDAS